MAKAGKCDPHEICEECPEWIFTLADLIMCMMGLFVIMWVLKQEGAPATAAGAQASTEQGKDGKKPPELMDAIIAIREAFGYEPDPSSNDAVDRAMILRKMQAGREGEGNKGTSSTRTEGAEGTDPDVTTIRLGPESAVGGPIAFAAGSTELSATAGSQIKQLAAIVRGHRQVILVKGHASLDDLPEDSTPQQRLDLSLRRAQAIADAMIAAGVSPEILRVLGCSTFEPVRQRAYTPDRRALNRRVEVEVTSTLVDQLQDPTPAPVAPIDSPGHETPPAASEPDAPHGHPAGGH